MFPAAIGFIGFNWIETCVSMSNRECKVRPALMNVNSDEPLFYPYSILVNKYSGMCNDINDPYAKLCVGDVIKDMNIKVFNILPRTNETTHASWNKTPTYKCRLHAGIHNNNQC